MPLTPFGLPWVRWATAKTSVSIDCSPHPHGCSLVWELFWEREEGSIPFLLLWPLFSKTPDLRELCSHFISSRLHACTGLTVHWARFDGHVTSLQPNRPIATSSSAMLGTTPPVAETRKRMVWSSRAFADLTELWLFSPALPAHWQSFVYYSTTIV